MYELLKIRSNTTIVSHVCRDGLSIILYKNKGKHLLLSIMKDSECVNQYNLEMPFGKLNIERTRIMIFNNSLICFIVTDKTYKVLNFDLDIHALTLFSAFKLKMEDNEYLIDMFIRDNKLSALVSKTRTYRTAYHIKELCSKGNVINDVDITDTIVKGIPRRIISYKDDYIICTRNLVFINNRMLMNTKGQDILDVGKTTDDELVIVATKNIYVINHETKKMVKNYNNIKASNLCLQNKNLIVS